jgi:hypothetical protein
VHVFVYTTEREFALVGRVKKKGLGPHDGSTTMLGVFRDGEVVRDAARWKFAECELNRYDDARHKHLSNVLLRGSEMQRHLRDRCRGVGWGVHLSEQVPNAFSNTWVNGLHEFFKKERLHRFGMKLEVEI